MTKIIKFFKTITAKIIRTVRLCINLLLEPVIGYTRMVSATKLILSAIALILTLVLIILPLINPMYDNFRLTFSSIEGGEKAKNPRMINPRFQGIDGEDQTYNIIADDATMNENEELTLNNLNADMSLNDGTWVSLLANKGVLSNNHKKLYLTGNVGLYTNSQYEFITDEITINMKDSSAYGTHSVIGKAPIGTIKADGFRLFDKGQRVIFTGRVKVVMYPESNFKFGEGYDDDE